MASNPPKPPERTLGSEITRLTGYEPLMEPEGPVEPRYANTPGRVDYSPPTPEQLDSITYDQLKEIRDRAKQASRCAQCQRSRSEVTHEPVAECRGELESCPNPEEHHEYQEGPPALWDEDAVDRHMLLLALDEAIERAGDC